MKKEFTKWNGAGEKVLIDPADVLSVEKYTGIFVSGTTPFAGTRVTTKNGKKHYLEEQVEQVNRILKLSDTLPGQTLKTDEMICPKCFGKSPEPCTPALVGPSTESLLFCGECQNTGKVKKPSPFENGF
jgi:hypothetical protein